MADREDIMAPRKKKDGGTYWVKIGTCWVNDGKRQLVFDSLPIPDADGRCVANLFEPRDKQSQGGGTNAFQEPQRNSRQTNTFSDDLSDDVPFLTSNAVW